MGSRGVGVDPLRTIDTAGKIRFNARIDSYNQAARVGGWFAMRDSDRDAGDCAARLRGSLLSQTQSDGLCLRLAVRTIEAWLLADAERFAEVFGVSRARIPLYPESLADPKRSLVDLCRLSRRRDVRFAVVPPNGIKGLGPEYTNFVGSFAGTQWRPDVAALSAPSLARATEDIDQMVASGRWV